MKIKKILSVLLTLCLFVNISFAFDPYADEEIEKKSYKKLYYGIALTLLGGFLAYDGFSLEKVDVSKPSVDFTTVSHSEWVQTSTGTTIANPNKYELRSGYSDNITAVGEQDFTKYEIDDQLYTIENNALFNNGNVSLKNITIEVAYKFASGAYIDKYGKPAEGEYYYDKEEGQYLSVFHTVTMVDFDDNGEDFSLSPATDISLDKGASVRWQDIWEYSTTDTSPPNNDPRQPYYNKETGSSDISTSSGTAGLNLGKDSGKLMDVRVKINKNQQYTPIYQTKHKSDAEGVAGILVGITGIYFIIDHFLDMHKFNAYVKRHHLNLRVATASNEYKLMLQKRI